ncbi:MAG: DUF1844 domain-containing protein, partial [Bdellovibrionia bacterium]
MENTNKPPKIDLTTFFLSIASAAFMGLGMMPSPQGGETKIDLELALQNIELLELIHAKTKGNRTPEEDRLIDQLLFETRVNYTGLKPGAFR